ncbi:acyl-CoA dehydrogenase family protein [Streptomyces sp. H10-C2]|uniref:acyl-CoA dehydrogenase family protein n=1 Tax=unclassified Streptomyces TaxID=2593676 RepID=UPI0024BA8B88|nr:MULTISPECIES: acyl-CoA dehydrogenase family protein [unclassified Streptomyces]MDJ0342429.1 acyl-CoA dehydrogenase family protein [Streptomyces sp. PH10-H1]MDJ0372284.1 acyl-CoA dehydrogenase family protein [Streptomyces sp. H10-C2]
MDAAFTEEQDEIRRTLREVLHKRCGPDEVKAAVGTPAGYDETLWRQLAEQLGLPGLGLPSEYGGAGCGPTELVLACEEAGRTLLPSPLFTTAVLAAPLIADLGSELQRADVLPRIASGAVTVALALPGGLGTALGLTGPNDGDWAGGGRAGGIQARQENGGWRLYGQADQVLGGHSAGLLLVAAHAGGYAAVSRTRLFLVEGDAAGVVRTRLTALDETRPEARIELRNVAAVPLGGDEAADPGPALARAGELAAAALAAEAVGAADQALASTVEYVQVREQFGRPVGSFQAIKHRLADLYVQVQAARSAAYYAAWAAAASEGDLPVAGPLALAQALEALRAVAGEAIQLHGGVGFTWEHHAHLYFKRAASDELLFGPVHLLRARAADRAGLFASAGPAVPTGTAEPSDPAAPATASTGAGSAA